MCGNWFTILLYKGKAAHTAYGLGEGGGGGSAPIDQLETESASSSYV